MKALIFDMDGTMIANKDYHDQAWINFCKTYHQDADIDDFINRYSGKTNEAILELVFGKKLSKAEILQYEEIKETMYREAYAPHFKLVDGLVDLLKNVKNKGIPMAVATSAPTVNVDFVLDTGNIRSYFEAIIDSSQIKEGKPSPEVFIKAAHALGVKPEDCVCFEDSKAGIAASRAAGMYTVGIATEHSLNRLIELGAHHAIVDFNEYLLK